MTLQDKQASMWERQLVSHIPQRHSRDTRIERWAARQRSTRPEWEIRRDRYRLKTAGRFLPIKVKAFWAKVTKTESCWLWNGPKVAHGYGQFTIAQGVHVMAHRYAWELANGRIPLKAEFGVRFHIHHICKVKNCVNPQHLQMVDPKEHRDIHKERA